MRSRGFTLVELMIAAALFGLIAAGAMSLVMTTSRVQATSARIDVAQSGLRAGMSFLSRDLLSASAGAKTGKMVDGATGNAILPIAVTDSSTGPDTLDVYLVDPTAMATVLAPVAAGSTSIEVDTADPFKSKDVLQLCDFDTATLITFVGASSAGGYSTLTVSGLGTLPAGVSSYAAGSLVFRSRHVTYAVDTSHGTSATADESMLTMDLHDGSGPQPLAEGIEDFQVALGFDDNGDGVVTEVGKAPGDDEWVFNVAGETAPLTLANLKLVRITLVAKATQAEPGQFSKPSKAEDHDPGSVTADGFPRRALTSEITVRNFNL